MKQLIRYFTYILSGKQAKYPVLSPIVMNKLRKNKKLSKRQQTVYANYKNYVARYDDES